MLVGPLRSSCELCALGCPLNTTALLCLKVLMDGAQQELSAIITSCGHTGSYCSSLCKCWAHVRNSDALNPFPSPLTTMQIYGELSGRHGSRALTSPTYLCSVNVQIKPFSQQDICNGFIFSGQQESASREMPSSSPLETLHCLAQSSQHACCCMAVVKSCSCCGSCAALGNLTAAGIFPHSPDI